MCHEGTGTFFPFNNGKFSQSHIYIYILLLGIVPSTESKLSYSLISFDILILCSMYQITRSQIITDRWPLLMKISESEPWGHRFQQMNARIKSRIKWLYLLRKTFLLSKNKPLRYKQFNDVSSTIPVLRALRMTYSLKLSKYMGTIK